MERRGAHWWWLFLLAAGVSCAWPPEAPAQRLAGEGRLRHEYLDFADGRVGERWALELDGRVLELAEPPQGEALDGALVRFEGTRQGDQLVAVRLSATSLAPEQRRDALSDRATPGTWRLAVVGFHQAGSAQPVITVEELTALVAQVKAFWAEASYGRLEVVVPPEAIFGPVTIPAGGSVELNVRAAAASAGYALAGYDNLLAVGRFDNPAYGGYATGSFAWALPEARYLAHEMGHLLGLGHATFLDCGTRVTGGTCTPYEYGDRFDVMGSPKLGHLGLANKLRLGFVDPAAAPQLAAGGTWLLEPLETVSAGLKGVHLRGLDGEYYVEYRRRVGFDANLDPSVEAGALVRLGARLLDLTPTAPKSELDSVLRPGASFTIPGVARLAVASVGAAGLSLTVTALPPVVDLDFDGGDAPAPADAPRVGRLSWQATGTCTLLGQGSSQAVEPSGFLDLELAPGTYSYRLRCTNSAGTREDTVKVVALEPTAAPDVELTVNGAPSVVVYADSGLWFDFRSSRATLGCVRAGAWAGPQALSGGDWLAAPAPGSYLYTVTCANSVGSTSRSVSVAVLAVPTVSVVAPLPGSFVRGTVPVRVAVSDFGALLAVTLDSPAGQVPFAGDTALWDTTGLADGPCQLFARGTRLDFMSVMAEPVSVTVDNTAPTVKLTAPSGAYVRGKVTLKATAADLLALRGVRFFVDGAPLGAELAGATVSAAWATTALPSNTTHLLTATATDLAGNSQSASRTVTVDNEKATISTPAVFGLSSTGATLSWTTSEPCRSAVQYGVASLSSTVSKSSYVASHSLALTGLSPRTSYRARAKATDRAGNVSYSVEVAFTTP